MLKLIAEAHTNKQIAEILHLAEKTVESHRANLLRKLGHARPRRARPLRDPARAHRGLTRRGRLPGRHYAGRAAARLAFALLTLTLCAAAAVAGVFIASRGDGGASGVAVGATGWAGFVRPPGRDGAGLRAARPGRRAA